MIFSMPEELILKVYWERCDRLQPKSLLTIMIM